MRVKNSRSGRKRVGQNGRFRVVEAASGDSRDSRRDVAAMVNNNEKASRLRERLFAGEGLEARRHRSLTSALGALKPLWVRALTRPERAAVPLTSVAVAGRWSSPAQSRCWRAARDRSSAG